MLCCVNYGAPLHPTPSPLSQAAKQPSFPKQHISNFLSQPTSTTARPIPPSRAGESRPRRRIAAACTASRRKGWWASARTPRSAPPCPPPPCRTAPPVRAFVGQTVRSWISNPAGPKTERATSVRSAFTMCQMHKQKSRPLCARDKKEGMGGRREEKYWVVICLLVSRQERNPLLPSPGHHLQLLFTTNIRQKVFPPVLNLATRHQRWRGKWHVSLVCSIPFTSNDRPLRATR